MNDFTPLAQLALGYAWQWTRGPKHVPNWTGYVFFCVASVAVWYWMTPDAIPQLGTDWRQATAKIVSFALSVRGGASFSSDVKVAPKTDTM